MTGIRQRLTESVFDGMFETVVSLPRERGLLKGKTLGLDATALEANAAMNTRVRNADGKNWRNYLRTLAQAEGIEEPSDGDLRRINRVCKAKKVSNETWESPENGDSRRPSAPLRDLDPYPGTKTGQAGVDEQAGWGAEGTPGQSATGSRRSRAAVEPLTARARGMDLCPRLQNRRWKTNPKRFIALSARSHEHPNPDRTFHEA
jgi:hypothetical protein